MAYLDDEPQQPVTDPFAKYETASAPAPAPAPKGDPFAKYNLPTPPKAEDFVPKSKPADNSIGVFVGRFLDNLNPAHTGLAIYRPLDERWQRAQRLAREGKYGEALGQAAMVAGLASPPGIVLTTTSQVAKAHWQMLKQAADALKAGRRQEAVGYAGAALLPLIGPTVAQAGEEFGRGEWAKGAADVASVIVPAKAGTALRAAPRMFSGFKSANPVIRSGMDRFGRPWKLRAGRVADNDKLMAAEHVADTTPVGWILSQGEEARVGARIAASGEAIAAKVSPTPMTREAAGTRTLDALVEKTIEHNRLADRHYTAARTTIESNPANVQSVQVGTETVEVPIPQSTPGGPTTQMVTRPVMEDIVLPVDLRPIKTALKPIYERLSDPMVYGSLSASARKAASLISDIVNHTSDWMGALDVDTKLLGPLKEIVRGTARGLTSLRKADQGIAARIIKDLSPRVEKMVRDAGAWDDLEKGRAATRAKYKTNQVLDKVIGKNARVSDVEVAPEGAKIADRLVASGDTQINLLRAVARHAPQRLPDLARAALAEHLGKSTKGGAYDHAVSALDWWNGLGDQTKQILYPRVTQELTDFFNAARQAVRPVNPSGSGTVVGVGLQVTNVGLAFTHPLTGIPMVIGWNSLPALLRSPTTIRVLTQGFRTPLTQKVGTTILADQLAAFAKPMTETQRKTDQSQTKEK